MILIKYLKEKISLVIAIAFLAYKDTILKFKVSELEKTIEHKNRLIRQLRRKVYERKN